MIAQQALSPEPSPQPLENFCSHKNDTMTLTGPAEFSCYLNMPDASPGENAISLNLPAETTRLPPSSRLSPSKICDS